MLPGERKRFAQCLLACAEVYGKQMSEAVSAIYWEALNGFEIAAVESAFWRHLRNADVGQFMPKPADVVRMLQGTSVDSALVAWTKVDKAVRTVGPYASVAFDDPLIHRTLQDMGGWIHLSTKTDDEWPFVANEFRNRYQGYRSRNETPEYPPRLFGIAEADNANRGIQNTPPHAVLIGDAQKARQVMLGGHDRPTVAIQRLGDMLLLEQTHA